MSKNVTEDASLVNQIKPGTHIEGEVKSGGDMRIDGTLKGKIHTQGKLVIGATGKIDGEIICQNAEIHGIITGKITVNELLSLKASSKLSGDIITGKLAIEPGALFSGSCAMGNAPKTETPGMSPLLVSKNGNGQETAQERAERKPQTVV